MATAGLVSWAAEVEAAEDFGGDHHQTEKVVETSDEFNLPSIPKEFDPEVYDAPEPVVVKKGDNVYTKYSWKVVCDPKASPDDEYPDEVIVQTIETFRTDTQRVNKRVAARRKWKKYGQSADDGPGPNGQTTNMQMDDIPVVFLNKAQFNKPADITFTQDEEEEFKKLRQQIQSALLSANLSGSKMGQGTMSQVRVKEGDGKPGPSEAGKGGRFFDRIKTQTDNPTGGTDNRPARIGKDAMNRMDEEGCGIRVTNLSENITDNDIHDLFGQCGRIRRCFLGRDKRTGKPKGFAYVTFEKPGDAQRAIRMLNKFTYDYLVLNVELSKNDPK